MRAGKLKIKRTNTCLFGIPLVIIIISSLLVYRLHDISETERDHASPLSLSRLGKNGNRIQSDAPSHNSIEVPLIDSTLAFEKSDLIHSERGRTQLQLESALADSEIIHNSITSPDYQLEKTTLPSFANDETEFIIGSIIERSSQSFDLFATTFMLCHYMLDSHNPDGVQEVHSAMKDTWQRAMLKFEKVTYLASGTRRQETTDEKFFCRIRHSISSTSYIVPGHFMPNRLIDDSHQNRKLDILRCPIMNSHSAYNDFAGSSELMSIEVLRGNGTLVSFTIPWNTRKTGFLLSNPPAASVFNSWKGYDISQKTNSKKENIDKLHVCVPSSDQIPSKNNLPLFLEFVSHHLLIGVSHIHLPVTFAWNSVHMNRYIDIFQSYIQEGMT